MPITFAPAAAKAAEEAKVKAEVAKLPPPAPVKPLKEALENFRNSPTLSKKLHVTSKGSGGTYRVFDVDKDLNFECREVATEKNPNPSATFKFTVRYRAQVEEQYVPMWV